MKNSRIALLAGLLALGAVALPAQADYTAALSALEKQDYKTAFPLMRKSAEAGDADAMYSLALMYWNGQGVAPSTATSIQWLNKAGAAGNVSAMNALAKLYMTGAGVPRDVLQARNWAEKSARLGNVDGEVAYYLSVVSGPELNYRESGQPDLDKYKALAKRSLSERQLDQQAYDMLGKALDQGSAVAKLYTVAEMVDKVGPGNSSRALTLVGDLKDLPTPLANVAVALQSLSGIGDSYANYTTFMNAKAMAQPAASALAQKAGYFSAGGCSPDDLKIAATAISRPLAGAVYLPATQHQLATVFLIAGNWQEKWTFDACGKTVSVPVEFQADGMGGATFQVKVPGA